MACNTCQLTLRDFIVLSSDRTRLVDFLINHGLLKRNITCSACQSELKLNIKTLTFQCHKKYSKNKRKKKTCKFKVSSRKGTWFCNSRISIEDISYMTVLWLRLPYPRQKVISRELKCSSVTVVNWSNYCREVCVQWAIRNSEKLGGHGKTIEIDEGRYNEGHFVFGGFERNSKKIFLVPILNRSTETLLEVMKEWIYPGTMIISEIWKAYDILDESFQHFKTNHSIDIADPVKSIVHTQSLRGKAPRCGRREYHFAGYLAELLFKRVHNSVEDIHEFFIQIAKLYTPQNV